MLIDESILLICFHDSTLKVVVVLHRTRKKYFKNLYEITKDLE